MSAGNFEQRVLELPDGQEGTVRYCTVDPKEEKLAACFMDGKIIVWKITEKPEILKTMKDGHTAEVTSCSFCSFGPILASSSRDKKVILWNYETGKRVSRLELHSGAVLFCAFSKDGKLLASASCDKTARLYKIRPGAGEFVPGGDVKELTGHTGAVNVVQFSPDGARALTGSDDNTIRVWHKESDWNCVHKLVTLKPVKSVIFSPGEPAVFASLDDNSRTTLWTMHADKIVHKNSVDIRSSKKELKAISFIPGRGRYIVGVASDGTVNEWNAAITHHSSWSTWTYTRPNQHKGPILSCCYAGKDFITADSAGIIITNSGAGLDNSFQ